MPRNGSGNYSLPTNAWNPAINGVSATPADWQALINDVAAAIQASVSADGQTPVTGNLQMGGHLLTGAGAPSGAGMSLRWEQLTRGADIPSATSITIPLEGQFFAVTGTTAITGFGATIAGRLVYIKFDAGIVLTNSASFILPAGANITTQADDIAVFLSVSIGVWECVSYPRVQNSAASSDHYGSMPPLVTWPGMTWADSGTNTLWRRNAANGGWDYEHRILGDATTDLPWLSKPIGERFSLDVDAQKPPTNDPRYRYIQLSAGLTGTGGYNEGVLTSESVSGSSPLVIATAVVSLATSSLYNKTVNLINTEERYLGAADTQNLQDDSFQGHRMNRNEGGVEEAWLQGRNFSNLGVATATWIWNTGTGFTTGDPVTNGVHGAPRVSSRTQPRTQRVVYYMRIL